MQLKVEGGRPIHGEVVISGNKNAVLPMIAAALLSGEKVTLRNVPDILDVRSMLEIASALGAETHFENNVATIHAEKLSTTTIPRELCEKNRTSILFAAPLVAREGSAELFPPGGDVIGRRRLDGHFYGLKTLGALLDAERSFRFVRKGSVLHGRELFLDEASVTATEQILMAAVLAKGQTTLYNAACEPHVYDLAEMLNSMGAKITGHGSNTILIDGVSSLHGADHTVVGDHIEAGSFLSLGVATGGELLIRGTTPRHYWMMRRVFERLGVEMILRKDSIYLPGGQVPKVKSDFGGHIPVLADGPWPQYPSDMMSCSIVAATQAEGTVMFFEKMFESRLFFVDRLISMGANAVLCDPHRVVISGRARLHGMTLTSPDIRAGMAMVIAALCASGTSNIHAAEVIYRGYEKLVPKLESIGCAVQEHA